ncbi:Uu.00g122110.m01.CDS01 [Anthostomella pinea]|uniref:Uu.00g122110.m01.CDS01 n=1 Tax=Anthostomella pinea TaxID=933095 RepID=A0AAI8YHI2_9PEZI|nr:Uu.00g122110.m01.CDS01 [Anthostomella pinea]
MSRPIIAATETSIPLSEIDRLKQKVKGLEEQLETERTSLKSVSSDRLPQAELTPPTSLDSPSVTDVSVPRDPARSRVWEGVYASTAQSPQKTWYGPSSAYYFISRMNAYLASVFQQLHPDDHIQLKSVAKSFATPDWTPIADENKADVKDTNLPTSTEDYLTPSQEEYFLDLFWQSYHTSLVILNEAEFKVHYKSLLAKPGKPRKSSALVDIVIAVSMQVGMAIIQRNSSRTLNSADVGQDDPSIAGRFYYRRCQRLLNSEQENPTIMTVQCHMLSAIYLCCASFQNMSHSALSLAVRTAHMLGLHTEPADDLPFSQKEMHRRLWWTLYTFESKTCMKLGRPFYADLYSTSCSLPADDNTVASLAGSDFAPLDENATWLTYTLHNTHLLLAARGVHMALYDKYPEIYNGSKGRVIYDDPIALECYAGFLASEIKRLDTWVRSVPNALKTKRIGGGVSLSTDHQPLAVEQFAPIWLQRQRLILELLYHNLAMNLYRPFISFPSLSFDPSPLGSMTRSHATSSVEHGMTLTRIMHQVLSESDALLTGWHEAFQWQWNAALTLAGYLFAHPDSAGTSVAVRQAIDLAVAAFEIFGRSFGAANSAAMVMRDLAAKIDFLADISRNSEAQPPALENPPVDIVSGGPFPEAGALVPPNENDAISMQNMLADSMDMAFSVDTSSNLDMLWPSIGNTSGEWWYDFNNNQGPRLDMIDESFA